MAVCPSAALLESEAPTVLPDRIWAHARFAVSTGFSCLEYFFTIDYLLSLLAV
jgi:hypothetical protein